MTEQCREFCEDGGAWAASSVGRKKLRSIANDATFRRKRVNPVYLRPPKGNGLKLTEGADARRARETAGRVEDITRFPDSIPAVEVWFAKMPSAARTLRISNIPGQVELCSGTVSIGM